jgi:hypothetical protein
VNRAASLARAEARIPALRDAGYDCVSKYESALPMRRHFVKSPPDSLRAHVHAAMTRGEVRFVTEVNLTPFQATGSPPRPGHPQLRIGVPDGSTLRNISTRDTFGFTTTGLRAALSSGRSALLSEYAASTGPP